LIAYPNESFDEDPDTIFEFTYTLGAYKKPEEPVVVVTPTEVVVEDNS
jgi:hypothetical protein